MRRLTLTIALVSIVAFAFGQRNAKQQAFSLTPSTTAKKLMQLPGEKSTNASYVWEEEFTDSIATGVNGLPDGWAYTPNDADLNNQWQWKKGYIGMVWTVPVTLEETFETHSATVPATNPTLFFNFFNSFYYSIENGQDSLYVEYESNGDGNWHWLWSNRNEAAIVASGVDYPYSNWDEHMARIQLPLTTVNQPIKFRVTASRTNGYSLYVESMALGSLANYDVEMTANACVNTYLGYNDTTYLDGLYQLMPLDQKKNFVYNKTAVKNYGVNAATNMVYTATYKAADGTLIAQKDTNAMFTGTDLTNLFDVDTFVCDGFDNIDAVVEGTYTLETKISYDNADEDTVNNYFSIDITYDAPLTPGSNNISHLARNTEQTSAVNVDNYNGAADGDQVGIGFKVSQECKITQAIIPLHESTTDQTGFTVKLYAPNTDGSAWEQIGGSDDVYTNASDGGTSLTVDLLEGGVILHPETDYMLICAAHYTPNVSKIYFSTFDKYKDFQNSSLLYKPAASLNIGGTWYYMMQIPCFQAVLETATSVEELNSIENLIKVYPNPTNGVLHIDNVNGATIEVYNMVGNMVDLINNANEFNTVDLSNYAEGTYLVKVYTETGVSIKKVNLIK